MIICKCDNCGKEIRVRGKKAESFKHHFCSRACAKTFTSPRMTAMNEALNPGRMTQDVRRKLREVRLDSGTGKTYTKTYGRHTHRVVAEQMLGRPLRPGEIVHHVDGDKRNNDPSNLMVFASQAEHARYHAMLKYHGVQGL